MCIQFEMLNYKKTEAAWVGKYDWNLHFMCIIMCTSFFVLSQVNTLLVLLYICKCVCYGNWNQLKYVLKTDNNLLRNYCFILWSQYPLVIITKNVNMTYNLEIYISMAPRQKRLLVLIAIQSWYLSRVIFLNVTTAINIYILCAI